MKDWLDALIVVLGFVALIYLPRWGVWLLTRWRAYRDR